MRKSILAAVAAGALAVAGAASAQDIGSVIGSLFGFGNTYPAYGTPSQPAVVAGTGYGTYGSQVPYGTQVYSDQYGRQFYYDQYGRQVMVQSQPASQSVIVGYDQWGRPIYGTTAYGSYGNYGNYGGTYGTYGSYAYRNDRDRDGVADAYDRWPDDARYR